MAIVPIDQLLYGIRSAESGGEEAPYSAVNSIGAHGAYQVMRKYIGPWTKEAFGRAMTPAEFLASPKAQDDLARFRLGRDMKRYGSWEKAAAVWFSGQPDPDSLASDGGNTVRQYVSKVRTAMAKWRGAGSGTPTPTTLPTAAATPALSIDPTGIIGATGALAQSMGSMARSFAAVGAVATFLIKLALPSTWVRIVCGIFGGAFLVLGLIVLGREARGTA